MKTENPQPHHWVQTACDPLEIRWSPPPMDTRNPEESQMRCRPIGKFLDEKFVQQPLDLEGKLEHPPRAVVCAQIIISLKKLASQSAQYLTHAVLSIIHLI
ncbi:hypothetical protein EVAR_101075_1 [Eumeta japonica]|uniref:Uncharacterized protein n=1 Tax=Eumeta variegata TaxID=151549 RepID=A0A4C2ACL3_EUMVA|nr:hypothetical protein EVAR_101075_1 [Eumeta japonica]